MFKITFLQKLEKSKTTEMILSKTYILTPPPPLRPAGVPEAAETLRRGIYADYHVKKTTTLRIS